MTVVIQREDQSTEIISRSRVTLAPTPKLTDQLIVDTRLQLDEELRVEVPVDEQNNINQLVIQRLRKSHQDNRIGKKKKKLKQRKIIKKTARKMNRKCKRSSPIR